MIGLSEALVRNKYGELFIQPEPAFSFAKSCLDSSVDNRAYFVQTCAREDAASVETFADVFVGWRDVSRRNLDLVRFDGLFVVLDHLDERVEFALAYDLEPRFGVVCAVNIRQWTSARVMSLTGIPKDNPESVSSFVMTERLLPLYPIVASPELAAKRFWWWRFSSAVSKGYAVYESDRGAGPVKLGQKDLHDRGWTQPQGREFPGRERVAIIAKPGVWSSF